MRVIGGSLENKFPFLESYRTISLLGGSVLMESSAFVTTQFDEKNARFVSVAEV
jgi:hypothetical protein